MIKKNPNNNWSTDPKRKLHINYAEEDQAWDQIIWETVLRDE